MPGLRPDARIPLGVKPFDIVTPLAQIGEQRRQEQRQSRIDASNLQTADLQRQNIRGEIAAREATTAAAASEAEVEANLGLLRSLVVDFDAAKGFLEGADQQNFAKVLLSTLDRVDQLGLPAQDIESILQGAQTNPQEAAQALGGLSDAVKAMLGSAMALSGQQAPETFSPIRDANNNIVGQQSSTTGRVFEDPRAVETFSPIRDANNNIVGQQSSTTRRVFEDPRAVEPSDSETNREAKIRDIMAQTNPRTGINFTRAEASKIVDNLIRTEQNPAGTGTVVIDEIQQSVREIGGPQADPQAQRERTTKSLYDSIDGGQGLFNAVSAFWANTAGQIPGAPISVGAVQDRARLTLGANPLIEALRQTERLGSIEIQRVEDMGQLAPSVARSIPATQAAAIVLDGVLRGHMANALAEAANENLATSDRQNAARDAQAIGDFLFELGVPRQISPEQITLESIPVFEVSDLKKFISSQSADTLDNLPPEVRSALMARIRNE
mgnify:CR=1 FL=1|jgi:hypothetical protein